MPLENPLGCYYIFFFIICSSFLLPHVGNSSPAQCMFGPKMRINKALYDFFLTNFSKVSSKTSSELPLEIAPEISPRIPHLHVFLRNFALPKIAKDILRKIFYEILQRFTDRFLQNVRNSDFLRNFTKLLKIFNHFYQKFLQLLQKCFPFKLILRIFTKIFQYIPSRNYLKDCL